MRGRPTSAAGSVVFVALFAVAGIGIGVGLRCSQEQQRADGLLSERSADARRRRHALACGCNGTGNDNGGGHPVVVVAAAAAAAATTSSASSLAASVAVSRLSTEAQPQPQPQQQPRRLYRPSPPGADVAASPPPPLPPGTPTTTRVHAIVHSVELWGNASASAAVAALPSTMVVDGAPHTLTARLLDHSEGADAAAAAAAAAAATTQSADVVLLLSAGVRLRAGGLVALLRGLLRHPAAAAVSCTLLAPGGATVAASGYEAGVRREGAVLSRYVAPRLLGEPASHADVVGVAASAAALLAGGDCMAFRTSSSAAAGELPRAVAAVAPVQVLRGQASEAALARAAAVLNGFEAALDAAGRTRGGSTAAAHAELRAQREAAGALAASVEPASWPWRRAVATPAAAGVFANGAAAVALREGGGAAAAAALLRAEVEEILRGVERVPVRDWVEVGWRVSRAAVLASEQVVPVVVVPGGAVAVYDFGGYGSVEPAPLGVLSPLPLPLDDVFPALLDRRAWYPALVPAPRASVVVVWVVSGCEVRTAEAEVLRGLVAVGGAVRVAASCGVGVGGGGEEAFAAGLPPHLARWLRARRLRGPAVDRLAEAGPVALVVGGQPAGYAAAVRATGVLHVHRMLVVARVAAHFTRVPAEETAAVARFADVAWASTGMAAEAYAASGLPVDVVAGAVDTKRFYPSSETTTPPPPPPLLLANVPAEDTLRFGGGAPMRVHFRFLSAFAWEARQGWDVLVEAYFRAFTSDDDVALYVAAAPDPAREREDVMGRIAKVVGDIVTRLAEQGRPRSRLPHLLVAYAALPEAAGEAPAAFAAADAFVLPARADGCGRRLLQAMAAGLPTIATEWGAARDFATAANAYPLRCEARALSQTSFYGAQPGKLWAQPDGTHLIELLRRVVDRPGEARARGLQASRDVRQRFSAAAAGERWLGAAERDASLHLKKKLDAGSPHQKPSHLKQNTR